MNKQKRDKNVCEVPELNLDDVITEEYFDGDMFVFQLNSYHQYFNTLKVNVNNNNSNNSNSNSNDKVLSLTIQLSKNKFEERGLYWYGNVTLFLESQSNMRWIELKVRENTGWKTRWTNALTLKYKNDNKIKKLFKSKHK